MQSIVLAKVESAVQAAQVGGLAGQTVTVSNVSALTNKMTLLPADPTQGAVVVKLDATRQVAEMKALLGKSVVVGKSPAALGGVGNWVALHPVAAGAKAAAAAAAAGTPLVMMKVADIGALQLPALVGQTVTVVQPPVVVGTKAATMLYLKPAIDGASVVAVPMPNALLQAKGLVGSTFTVVQSPVVGGPVGKFLVLKPVATGTAVAAKTAAGSVVVAKAAPVAGAAAAAGAGGAAATGGLVSIAGGAANPIGSAVAGSSMLGGKGVALGLGLGLGAWGPLLLGVAGIVGAGFAWRYVQRRHVGPLVSDDELLAAAIAD
jgi:hypothetical protein